MTGQVVTTADFPLEAVRLMATLEAFSEFAMDHRIARMYICHDISL